MSTLPLVDLLGYWLGIFLTLSILSFLYKDNPFYKLAEHAFIGISIGYIIIQQYYNTLRPKLVGELGMGHWLALIPLALVLMMIVKGLSQRFGWVGRYPLAFVVAFYAGLQINGVTSADIGKQVERAMADPVDYKTDVNTADRGELFSLGLPPAVVDGIIKQRAQKPFTSLGQIADMPDLSAANRADVRGSRGPIVGLDSHASIEPGRVNAFGTFSQILLFLGLIAALIYFYFSVEHKGVIGKVSRFGVWILMIGFGASFGYTVMGRLALMIGRIQEIRGDTMPSAVADQVHGPWVALASIIIIVGGIVAWELLRSDAPPAGPAQGGDDGDDSDDADANSNGEPVGSAS